MYAFRTSHGPADLCFTDRSGGDLALEAPPANLDRVVADFAPGLMVCDLVQVHGDKVDVVEDRRTSSRPHGDALVLGSTKAVLVVRAADCVPVLFHAPEIGAVAAAHCGRPGLQLGIVPRTVEKLRAWGDTSIYAWIGPHVCGECYEVPEPMRDEVAAVVPASRATTSWGTPSLDLGAGVRSQLEELDVVVTDVSRCTRESGDLFSYRREGAAAGRQAGMVRLRS